MNELDDEILKKAAAALPLVPYDESLTASIMQQVELESQSAPITAPESVIQNTKPLAGPAFDWHSAALMLLSFIAFVAFLPLDTDESAWSIASWAVALVVLLLFKPLLAPPAKANGVKSYA